MKRIVSTILLLSVFPSIAFAAVPTLSITTDGNGCPTDVPGDNSCGPNTHSACRNNGAVVRWATRGNAIETIAKKAGSAGQLHACHATGAGYQCVVKGKSGDHVMYSVKLKGCPALDPTIIIK